MLIALAVVVVCGCRAPCAVYIPSRKHFARLARFVFAQLEENHGSSPGVAFLPTHPAILPPISSGAVLISRLSASRSTVLPAAPPRPTPAASSACPGFSSTINELREIRVGASPLRKREGMARCGLRIAAARRRAGVGQEKDL